MCRSLGEVSLRGACRPRERHERSSWRRRRPSARGLEASARGVCGPRDQHDVSCRRRRREQHGAPCRLRRPPARGLGASARGACDPRDQHDASCRRRRREQHDASCRRRRPSARGSGALRRTLRFSAQDSRFSTRISCRAPGPQARCSRTRRLSPRRGVRGFYPYLLSVTRNVSFIRLLLRVSSFL